MLSQNSPQPPYIYSSPSIESNTKYTYKQIENLLHINSNLNSFTLCLEQDFNYPFEFHVIAVPKSPVNLENLPKMKYISLENPVTSEDFIPIIKNHPSQKKLELVKVISPNPSVSLVYTPPTPFDKKIAHYLDSFYGRTNMRREFRIMRVNELINQLG